MKIWVVGVYLEHRLSAGGTGNGSGSKASAKSHQEDRACHACFLSKLDTLFPFLKRSLCSAVVNIDGTLLITVCSVSVADTCLLFAQNGRVCCSVDLECLENN